MNLEPNWFTLTSIDGTINITPSPYWNATIKEYSLDEGETWNLWDEISVISGTSIKLRGMIGSSVSGVDSPWIIDGTNVYCSGNIETLLDYESILLGNPPRHITENAYASMFQGCTALITPPELPTTVIDSGCYYSMFKGCINLIRTPELPSTTLTYMCYYKMFEDCTSLTIAPRLPAINLVNNCYGYMFCKCTSLITIPELPSISLAVGCYEGMFAECTSLSSLPQLPATTLVNTCYLNMFKGCSNIKLSETKFGDYQTLYRIPINGEGIIATESLDDMFKFTGGTFTGTPTINATYYTTNVAINYLTFTSTNGLKVTPSPYWNASTKQYSIDGGLSWIDYISGTTPLSTLVMFRGLGGNAGSSNEDLNNEPWIIDGVNVSCSGDIETILDYREVASGNHPIMGVGCYHNMFRNQPIITPPRLPAIQLIKYCYDSMFAGCTSLIITPELPATILADNCYSTMFIGCTSLTSAPKLPATELANNCYSGMFIGCESLKVIPKLTATTLAKNCYYVMFTDCTSLNVSENSGNVEFLNCTNLPISSEYASNMFYGTTGSFRATPKQGDKYYYNTSVTTYTVTFNSMGGSSVPSQTVEDGDVVVEPSPNPTKSGYIFNGWYKDVDCTLRYNFNTTVTSNFTLYAKWDAVVNPSVTLSGIPTSIVTGSSFTASAVPIQEAYALQKIEFIVDGTVKYTDNTPISGVTSEYNFNTSELILGSHTFTVRIYDIVNNAGVDSKVFKVEAFVKPSVVLTLDKTTITTTEGCIMTAVVTQGSYTITNLYFKVDGAIVNTISYPITGMSYNWNVDGSSLNIGNHILSVEVIDNASYNDIKTQIITVTSPTPLNDCITFILNNEAVIPLSFIKASRDWDGKVFYSLDKVSWTEWDGTTIYFNTNRRIYFYGEGNTKLGYWQMATSSKGYICIEGRLDTMLESLGFGACQSMFTNCTDLKSVPLDFLPFTSIKDNCYSNMFTGCTKLEIAPNLPATELANYCYASMFNGCSLLVRTPNLPATKLATGCYGSMFYGCTSLTTAPELPATTLANSCYGSMFSGCTSLTITPKLSATTLVNGCYGSMFAGCTSLTTPPELPATTLTGGCYNQMFSGCTSLVTTPMLPATMLANECYFYMFNGCTSLNISENSGDIEFLDLTNTSIPYPYCTLGMFYGTGGSFTNTPTQGNSYYYNIKEDEYSNKK